MISRPSRRKAFSLIEVTAALSIAAISLIALMGLVPVGLVNTRACKDETRAAELAKTVYSTLLTEPFVKAHCFSDSQSPVDLTSPFGLGTDSPATLLFASFDPRRAFPKIIRAESEPTEFTGQFDRLRIELHNRPDVLVQGETAVRGSSIRLVIYAAGAKDPIYSTSSYIGNFQRAGLLLPANP